MARKPGKDAPLGLSLLAPESNWVAPSEFPSLHGVKRIGVDVETRDPQLRDLGPGTLRDGYVVGLAVGTDDGRRWYFPTRHQGGGNLDEGMVWRWAREELNAFCGDVLGARLIYDLDYLWNYGVKFPNVRRFHDVQIAEPLLNEHRFEYNLGALAKDYLGEAKRETLLREAADTYGFGKTDNDIKENLWRLPASYVGPYAEGDVDLPFGILDKQLVRLEEEGLLDLFDLESRLTPVLLSMRRRGVRVDVARAQQVRAKLVTERDGHLTKLRRLAGPKAEFMAPDSFAQALVERGLPVGRTAKSGQYSVTQGWLKEHEGDELVDAIQAGRKVNTIITTFIDGHILSHAVNGRIHCEFVQLKDGEGGTGGRFSSRNPNLQNVPARDDYLAPLVRGLFIPEDDAEWEQQDQSQMEYRLLVHFARGQGAAEARERYRNDPTTDFHKLCASFIGADPDDQYVRKKIKGLNFAKSYGALANKIAIIIGGTVEEAQQFIDLYERSLPFTKTTFDAAQATAKQNGVVKSILGRRARFPLWEPADNYRKRKADRSQPLPRDKAEYLYGQQIVRANTYKALNNILQFSNADYTKKVMVDVWEAGLCADDALGPMLLQVHDELDYNVPKTERGYAAAAEAKRLMETAIPLRVPVMVSSKRGVSWGACE